MPLTRISGLVIAILLVISVSIGALLTITINERNTARASLKETKQKLDDEKKEADKSEASFRGCLGQLGNLNQYIADQSAVNEEAAALATKRAEQGLAKLPELIKSDRLSGAQPAHASLWVKDLFSE